MTSASASEPPPFADQAHPGFDVATATNNSEVGGFDLVVQVGVPLTLLTCGYDYKNYDVIVKTLCKAT